MCGALRDRTNWCSGLQANPVMTVYLDSLSGWCVRRVRGTACRAPRSTQPTVRAPATHTTGTPTTATCGAQLGPVPGATPGIGVRLRARPSGSAGSGIRSARDRDDGTRAATAKDWSVPTAERCGAVGQVRQGDGQRADRHPLVLDAQPLHLRRCALPNGRASATRTRNRRLQRTNDTPERMARGGANCQRTWEGPAGCDCPGGLFGVDRTLAFMIVKRMHDFVKWT